MKPIYLCGFMGCGKSTVGRRLAKSMGAAFTDLDDYIVAKAGRSIPEIFESQGEAYFRQLESDCLKELSQKSGMVIAAGGGTFLREDNVAAAQENGLILFLDVPFEVCYRRIAGDANRPIAANSTKEELLALWEQRKPLYESACHFSVQGTLTPAQTVEAILDRLNTGRLV